MSSSNSLAPCQPVNRQEPFVNCLIGTLPSDPENIKHFGLPPSSIRECGLLYGAKFSRDKIFADRGLC